MNENNNAYPVYYDPSIKDDNIIISGMQQCDFKCGDPLFLINIEKLCRKTNCLSTRNRPGSLG